MGSVTTEIIPLYTTVCPVAEQNSDSPASALAPPLPGHITSTEYSKTVYTITQCPESIADCPARLGSVTTEIVSLYTTVYPISNSQTTPSNTVIDTVLNNAINYVTVKVSRVQSNLTVTPVLLSTPAPPYPTSNTETEGKNLGTGAAVSFGFSTGISHSPVITMQRVEISPAPGNANSHVATLVNAQAQGSTTAAAFARPSSFTGAGSTVTYSSAVVIILCIITCLLL